MALLDIDKLTLWYESLFGDIRALDRCSLSVEEGMITCLLGVNGAGKTTLFRTVSGVIEDFDAKITKGHIVWEGKDITHMSAQKIVSLGIGHAPQDRHVFFTLPVEDNLSLGAYTKRRDRGAVTKAMKKVFELFPVLEDRRGQKSGTLSGGEQQMLAIGRALMCDPRLLLLDEPFLGLAPIVVEEILEALVNLNKDGLTIFLAEQNAREALSVSHRGFVMDEGFIVESGESKDLLESAKIREIYLGENV